MMVTVVSNYCQLSQTQLSQTFAEKFTVTEELLQSLKKTALSGDEESIELLHKIVNKKNNKLQIKCVIFNSLRALGHDKENSLKRVINSFNSELMGEMSNNNIKVHLNEPEIIFLHADLQQYLSQSCGAFVCMAAQEVIEQRESNSDSAPYTLLKNY
ncbi:TPA: hypothetical protein L7154_001478, partial [Escherichia coli]|nr:hypothetical protein [Escherichia coli]